jgi:hypothetical protein
VSRENVDLVRSIYAPWARGDFSSAEWADPEIELVFADWPPGGSWWGIGGLSQGFGDFLRAWDEFRVEAKTFQDLDDERVLGLHEFGGRGRASRLDVGGSKGAALFHVRNDKVIKLVLYGEQKHALADLGLVKEDQGRE